MSRFANIEGELTPDRRFEALNDVDLWMKRLLPQGGFDLNTPSNEYIRVMSDEGLRDVFKMWHGRFIDVVTVMENLAEELAFREAYER